MIFQGHIENGQVVLEDPSHLPDGAKVVVSVQSVPEESNSVDEFPSLYDRLKSVAGKAKGLPTDLAINHDHYLHGQPKRH